MVRQAELIRQAQDGDKSQGQSRFGQPWIGARNCPQI